MVTNNVVSFVFASFGFYDSKGRFRTGGVLIFILFWDVQLAAQDPYPCSGVIFAKEGTHI